MFYFVPQLTDTAILRQATFCHDFVSRIKADAEISEVTPQGQQLWMAGFQMNFKWTNNSQVQSFFPIIVLYEHI